VRTVRRDYRTAPVKLPAAKGHCACGEPLHYGDSRGSRVMRRAVEKLARALGENIVVTVGTRRWLVQRHYIALHGLSAQELPSLGFPEIGPEEYVLKEER
jgi:hypothetical protein